MRTCTTHHNACDCREEYISKLEAAGKFYADPHSYEKGYVYNPQDGMQGLLTDPPVIQDGGRKMREALGNDL